MRTALCIILCSLSCFAANVTNFVVNQQLTVGTPLSVNPNAGGGANVWNDNATVGSIDGTTISQLIFVSSLITASSSGTVDSLRVHVDSVPAPGTETIKMAIYDSGGTLVGEATPLVITTSGWNALSVVTPFSVTAGASYRVDLSCQSLSTESPLSTSTSTSSYFNYTYDYSTFPHSTQYGVDGTPGFGGIVVGYHIQ